MSRALQLAKLGTKRRRALSKTMGEGFAQPSTQQLALEPAPQMVEDARPRTLGKANSLSACYFGPARLHLSAEGAIGACYCFPEVRRWLPGKLHVA